ncbi:hypothetical protein [Streptacidiphilus sp. PAMC 29251]
MSSAKLAAALPTGDANGLDPIVRPLLDRPDRMQVVIALVDNKSTITDNDTGNTLPTLRIRRIEAVLRMDLSTVEQILRRSVEARTGTAVLPLELEDELSAIFAGLVIDKDTGEITDVNAEGPEEA